MWGYDEDEEESRWLAYPSLDSSPRSLIGAFFTEDRSLFNLESMSLRPLWRVEETGDSITVTFDLPRVEKRNITLSSTENSVSVEAKMKRPVSLRVGGTVQKRLAFERYTAHVRLPRPVDPDRAKATFKNGLLRVTFPIAKKGYKVKIQ